MRSAPRDNAPPHARGNLAIYVLRAEEENRRMSNARAADETFTKIIGDSVHVREIESARWNLLHMGLNRFDFD